MAKPKIKELVHDVSRDELLGLNIGSSSSDQVKLPDYNLDEAGQHALAKIYQASARQASVTAQIKQQLPAAQVETKAKVTSYAQSHSIFSRWLKGTGKAPAAGHVVEHDQKAGRGNRKG